MSTNASYYYTEEEVTNAPEVGEIDASSFHEETDQVNLEEDFPLGQSVREQQHAASGKRKASEISPDEEEERVKKLRNELKELYAANPHLTAPQSHRFLTDVDKLSAHECELALLHARAQIGRDTAARITQLALRLALAPLPMEGQSKNQMLQNMMSDAYFLNSLNFYIIDSMNWLPSWVKVGILGAGHLVEGFLSGGGAARLWSGGAPTAVSQNAPIAEPIGNPNPTPSEGGSTSISQQQQP